eukprot:15855843-Heterocapsa_arctica.AAC.1
MACRVLVRDCRATMGLGREAAAEVFPPWACTWPPGWWVWAGDDPAFPPRACIGSRQCKTAERRWVLAG